MYLKALSPEALYVAAVLEGEGSFTIKRDRKTPSPRVACEMSDQDIIDRLHTFTGVGTVCAIKPRKENHKPTWKWTVQAAQDAAAVMLAVYPYMGHRRQAKIKEILAEYPGYAGA